ncbi:DUF6087 family protein [Streptomyces chattanoogensis]|uniref:Uncharacterized protein n=1 Tax=Streptomyces chattanoogensis TaxID=66876 RepID=A0A0N0XWU1_9ACTN|nr:DUF6087 family protein [Streptomyces chattanoogensis]KPC62684.1 hypothetical protein ADL29_18260 [Streptomyces chattanoogensis]
MDDEESLAEWARKREQRRARNKGQLRAVPLSSGPHCGAHVEPDAPRVIQEHDGTEWVTVSVVESLAAAKAILYPPQPAEEKPTEWDRPALGKGRGRHRRPSSAKDSDA